ncbi:hypothetical protein [Corynebacterium variabile]|uniref:hypothetical protein n=1 Tax=Corynebacterium variabile TaxID=1727 RepID=UPI00289A4570|nr:hypothetical protein [Corynebacterium variabile]
MELKEKSVVVTGGGAGIGREVARQLIDKGRRPMPSTCTPTHWKRPTTSSLTS